MKTIKKGIYMLLALIMLINTLSPIVTAYTVKLGDKTRLYAERELPGFVQYKSDSSLKLVYRVYYQDKNGERLEAFCLEPLDPGVGTGGGDNYLTEITKEIDDARVWRALYHGYFGKKWNETTTSDTDNKEMKSGPVVESDDDWYFVTKLVIHCLNEKQAVSPKTKYEVPTHIANSDKKLGLTLEDVQRRGKKILDAAEKLYNYATTSKDNYETATISLEKSGSIYSNGNNLVQDFKLNSNKEIGNYEVLIEGFKAATYTKNGTTISVKIPKSSIMQDVRINVKINKAQIKTYPAFFAKAENPDYQDYVVVANPYEELSTSTTFELKTNNSKMEIMKIDKDTKEPVSNTTLEISKDGSVVTTVKTDESGKATIENLYPGIYDVKEIEANENYILSDEVKKVELEYNGVARVTFENTRKTGNLKLIKVDKDNNQITLGNVEFDLYSEEKGKVIGTYYTNADGEILVENLRVGNYSWLEKSTNKWYKLNDTKTLVTVKENETVETKIENELKKGQIKVIKVDKENKEIKLKDVEFNVIDEKGNILETIKTDKNGEALTKKYAVRDFSKLTLQETKTLENYVLDEAPKTVTLKENQISSVVFENEVKKGQIKVIKIDADNNEVKLPDVEFKIYDQNGEVVDTLITDKNGEAISKKLPLGQEYKVKETKTGKWYVLDQNAQTVVLKQGEITNLVFKNEKKKGQIKVIKVDKDNNEIKLEGVEFEVYDEAGNLVESLVTDQNGEAVTKKLPIDQKYTIKETKTLENYVLSDEEKTVVLEENQITTLNFANEKIKGYIEITKVSADDNSITNEKKGTALKGAIFEIYNEKDELVDTITTKEDGKATSKLLEYGKYYIKEKDTGSKYYVLNTNKYEIEINQNLKTVGITIENKSVEVKKKLPRTGF